MILNMKNIYGSFSLSLCAHAHTMCVNACVCMHAHVYGYTAYACGCQRSTLHIVPLDLSALFFKDRACPWAHSLGWNGWPQSAHLSQAFSLGVVNMHLLMWDLWLEPRSWVLQGKHCYQLCNLPIPILSPLAPGVPRKNISKMGSVKIEVKIVRNAFNYEKIFCCILTFYFSRKLECLIHCT